MSWEREPLWQKSRLFFERAFDESQEDPTFGLWCSLGLELLARSAIASISPTLLAEPDVEHKHLLHALGKGSDKVSRKSLGTVQVLNLCKALFPAFTDEDWKVAVALVNRRNEEVHSGAGAFAEFPPRQWLVGFYRCCKALAEAQNETLVSLLGAEQATFADEALTESNNDVRQRVQSAISAHRKVFEAKTEPERVKLAEGAKASGDKLAHERHHRVQCPSCKSVAVVQGEVFSTERITHKEDAIVVRQAVSPKIFSCPACGLKLTGYGELDAAGLGGQYTRTTEYSPADYFGLVDPESIDPMELYANYIRQHPDREYDNE